MTLHLSQIFLTLGWTFIEHSFDSVWGTLTKPCTSNWWAWMDYLCR